VQCQWLAKPEVLEAKSVSVTLSTTNLTRMGLKFKSGMQGERPAIV